MYCTFNTYDNSQSSKSKTEDIAEGTDSIKIDSLCGGGFVHALGIAAGHGQDKLPTVISLETHKRHQILTSAMG